MPITKVHDPILEVTWYLDTDMPENKIMVTDEEMFRRYSEEIRKLIARGAILPRE